jgi:hypothetical protein
VHALFRLGGTLMLAQMSFILNAALVIGVVAVASLSIA